VTVTAALTCAEKIWREHVIVSLGGGVDLLHIDRHFLHELSGAMSFKGLDGANRRVFDRGLIFSTVNSVNRDIVQQGADRSD
jgi:3-isopropylmalate/(R)-2-methylmalate dehydratase large subunit